MPPTRDPYPFPLAVASDTTMQYCTRNLQLHHLGILIRTKCKESDIWCKPLFFSWGSAPYDLTSPIEISNQLRAYPQNPGGFSSRNSMAGGRKQTRQPGKRNVVLKTRDLSTGYDSKYANSRRAKTCFKHLAQVPSVRLSLAASEDLAASLSRTPLSS